MVFYLIYFPLYSSPSLLIDSLNMQIHTLIGTDGFPGGLGHSQPPVGMYLFNQAKLKF